MLPHEAPTIFVEYGLGKRLPERLKQMGFKVQRHLFHLREEAEDTDWISLGAGNGWILITKDAGIRKRKVQTELAHVLATGAKIIELYGSNRTFDEQVAAIEDQILPAIGDLLAQPGAAIVSIYHRADGGFRRKCHTTEKLTARIATQR